MARPRLEYVTSDHHLASGFASLQAVRYVCMYVFGDKGTGIHIVDGWRVGATLVSFRNTMTGWNQRNECGVDLGGIILATPTHGHGIPLYVGVEANAVGRTLWMC